jgi:hypothetical protein
MLVFTLESTELESMIEITNVVNPEEGPTGVFEIGSLTDFGIILPPVSIGPPIRETEGSSMTFVEGN